jgi:hypothetical protein
MQYNYLDSTYTLLSQPGMLGPSYALTGDYIGILTVDPSNPYLSTSFSTSVTSWSDTRTSSEKASGLKYMILAQRGPTGNAALSSFQVKQSNAKTYSDICGGCVGGVIVYDNVEEYLLPVMVGDGDGKEEKDIGMIMVGMDDGRDMVERAKEVEGIVVHWNGEGVNNLVRTPSNYYEQHSANRVLTMSNIPLPSTDYSQHSLPHSLLSSLSPSTLGSGCTL